MIPLGAHTHTQLPEKDGRGALELRQGALMPMAPSAICGSGSGVSNSWAPQRPSAPPGALGLGCLEPFGLHPFPLLMPRITGDQVGVGWLFTCFSKRRSVRIPISEDLSFLDFAWKAAVAPICSHWGMFWGIQVLRALEALELPRAMRPAQIPGPGVARFSQSFGPPPTDIAPPPARRPVGERVHTTPAASACQVVHNSDRPPGLKNISKAQAKCTTAMKEHSFEATMAG